MSIRPIRVIRALWIVVFALSACNFTPQPAATPTGAPLIIPTGTPGEEIAPPTASERVEAILAGMTLEERVGQMFMFGYYDASPTLSIIDLVEQGHGGGIVLFAHNVGNPQETAEITNALQTAAMDAVGVPLLISTDQEGGIVSRLREGFATWPNPMAISATGNLQTAERVGAAMGQEMRAVGINMNLAPLGDVVDNPENAVIGVRSFGSNPAAVAAFAGAVMRGYHAAGVIATAKHFPGHGSTFEDSHETLPVDTRARAQIEASIQPFAALIDGGVDAVMTAHVVYPSLSDDGLPATLSRTILTDLLRGQLGFQGVIITDALSMDAILLQYSVEEAAQRAILAGVDMLTFGRGVSPEQQLSAAQHIITLVRAGEIAPSRIDASVRRILTLKERYGLLDWEAIDSAAVSFDLRAHQALSFEVAADALTLLWDQRNLVPLSADQPTLLVYPMDFFGAPDLFRAYDADIEPIGLTYEVSQEEQQQVISAAANYPQIVVLTIDANRFPGQAALVRALPAERTIVVAIRSPYDLLDFPNISAYALTYGGGDYALSSLARMLYGGTGAPGRLPVDIPGLATNGLTADVAQ